MSKKRKEKKKKTTEKHSGGAKYNVCVFVLLWAQTAGEDSVILAPPLCNDSLRYLQLNHLFAAC